MSAPADVGRLWTFQSRINFGFCRRSVAKSRHSSAGVETTLLSAESKTLPLQSANLQLIWTAVILNLELFVSNADWALASP